MQHARRRDDNSSGRRPGGAWAKLRFVTGSGPCFTEWVDAPGTGEGGAEASVDDVTVPAGPRGAAGSVQGRATRPAATPMITVDIPETLRYRLKNKLLGPPIAYERQASARL